MSKPRSPRMSEAVVGVIQLAVGACFGYAAVSKLAAFRSFEQGVASFDIVGSRMVRPVATVVVALESVAAFCLVTGQALLWGAGVSAALLAGFAIAIVSATRRGVAASCTCFGGDAGDSASPRTYLRLALLGAGVAVALTDALGSGDSRPAFSWAVIGRRRMRSSRMRDLAGGARSACRDHGQASSSPATSGWGGD